MGESSDADDAAGALENAADTTLLNCFIMRLVAGTSTGTVLVPVRVVSTTTTTTTSTSQY
jgi:hypothetical protein